MPDRLYHVAIPDEWERARVAGAYTMSTRGRSLDDEGFIHCSYRHQVEQVANVFYADVPCLMLLEIDRTQLNVAVVDEHADGDGEAFPHVYGPIPVHAIVADEPWERTPDGRYVLAGRR